MRTQYHFVGGDYAGALRKNPCGRVLVLLLDNEPFPEDMEQAVSGFQVLQTIDDREAKAILYSPKGCTR